LYPAKLILLHATTDDEVECGVGEGRKKPGKVGCGMEKECVGEFETEGTMWVDVFSDDYREAERAGRYLKWCEKEYRNERCGCGMEKEYGKVVWKGVGRRESTRARGCGCEEYGRVCVEGCGKEKEHESKTVWVWDGERARKGEECVWRGGKENVYG